MAITARQSTARIVTVGPVLDANGVAVTNGVVAEFKISKNGATPAALNASATLTHRHTGNYSLALTASDLDTIGSAEITLDDTVNATGIKEITVIEEAVYDLFYADGSTGTLPIALAGPYTRTITVTDSATTLPIELARVRLYRTGETETQLTNTSGVVVFTTVAATFSYAVIASGYVSTTGTIVITANGSTAISLTAISVATPTLGHTARRSLAVSVIDRTT